MRIESIAFPRYDGRTDPRRWVSKMTSLFRLQQIEDQPGTRAEIAVTLLDGPAADWAELHHDADAHLNIDWADWSQLVIDRFVRDQDPDRARDQLRHIFQKRRESLIAYAERFALMCSRAQPAVDPDDYYKYWLRGLRNDRAAEYAFTRLAASNNAPTYEYAVRYAKYATEARKNVRGYEETDEEEDEPEPQHENRNHPTVLKENGARRLAKTGRRTTTIVAEEPAADDSEDEELRQLISGLTGLLAKRQEKRRARRAECNASRFVESVSEDEDDEGAEATARMADEDEQQPSKRRRGAAGKKARKPRKKPELDREWADYAAQAWAIPLRFLKGRSKREVYSQVILALRDAFGFTPKPKKKKGEDEPSASAPPQQTDVYMEPAAQQPQGPQQYQATLAQKRGGRDWLERCKVFVAGRFVPKVIVDPGSSNSIMDAEFARQFRIRHTTPSQGTLLLADGSVQKPLGRTDEVRVEVGGVWTQQAFSVLPTKNSYDILLGTDWLRTVRSRADFEEGTYTLGVKKRITVVPKWRKLFFAKKQPAVVEDDTSDASSESDMAAALEELIEQMQALASDSESEDEDECFLALSDQVLGELHVNPKLKPEVLSDIRSLVSEYVDCFALTFQDMVKTPLMQFEIELRQGEVAKRCGRTRRLAPKETEFVKAQIDELLEAKLIIPWEEAARKYGCPKRKNRWLSPITIAPKKDGSFRFCCAYQRLNDATIPDKFVLPRADDLLDRVMGHACYSALDGFSGYYSLGLHPESVLKTAFATSFGVFCWLVLPFGVTNGPAAYSRLVEQVYGGLDRVGVFIDDVCCAHQSEAGIVEDLRRVFARCRDGGLRLKPKKCFVGYREVDFLGHRLCPEGMRMDEAKVEKISRMPSPTDRKQLQSLYGMFSYYRRFLKNFAGVSAPMSSLLSTRRDFLWTPEAQKALEELKKLLVDGAVLTAVNEDLPFLVDTDASAYGIGAVLSQEQDGEERPIYFYSRLLKDAETRYSATEREGLALVAGLKKFRVYVLGRKVVARTDHAALSHMLRKTDLTGRIARWKLILSEYDVHYVTRPGERHRNADGLSRLVDEDSEPRPVNKEEECDECPALVAEDVASAFEACREYAEILPSVNEQDSRFRWGERNLFFEDLDGRRKICLLPNQVRAVVGEEHCVGHFSAEITLQRVRQRYWFPKMRKQVQDLVKTCQTCQLFGSKPPIRSTIPIAIEEPWELVELDTVVGLPATPRKAVGFVTAIDCFTGFVITDALTSLGAAKTLKFFINKVVCAWGVPQRILTDNGTEFQGVFSETVKNLRIEHRWSTPRYPRSHGKVENVQRLVLDRLRKCQNPRSWDENLPAATFAVNARRGKFLSPLELLTGVVPKSRTEVNLLAGESKGDAEPLQTALADRLTDLALCRERFRDSAKKIRESWTAEAAIPRIEPGKEVRVYRLEDHGKLEAAFEKGVVTWWGNQGACRVLVDGRMKRVPQFCVKPWIAPQ